MFIPHKAITIKDIQNYINELLIKYDFTTKELSDLLDVEPKIITDYKNEYKNMPISKKHSFCSKLMIIYYMDDFSIDGRTKDMIGTLNTKHNISINTISKLASVDKKFIDDFMIKPEEVPDNIKYKLSVFVNMIYSFYNNK